MIFGRVLAHQLNILNIKNETVLEANCTHSQTHTLREVANSLGATGSVNRTCLKSENVPSQAGSIN